MSAVFFTDGDHEAVIAVALVLLSALVGVSTLLDSRMTRRARRHAVNTVIFRRAALYGWRGFVCCQSILIGVLVLVATERAFRVIPYQIAIGILLLAGLWLGARRVKPNTSSTNASPSERPEVD